VVEVDRAYRIDNAKTEGGCARAHVTEIATSESFELAPSLPGEFQLQNALNAAAAALELRRQGFRISNEAITKGISKTSWPGRLEKLQSNPDVYLDGAHNPSAARELSRFWEHNFADRRILLLYGALRDKAVDEIAGLLFPRATEVVFTEPRTSRAISAGQLADIAGHHAERSSVIVDAEEALGYLLAKAKPEDAIFITGSLYLVGELRHYWRQRAQLAAR
jgi:dihydrofolate synthase / folylpolyglutamate synthase